MNIHVLQTCVPDYRLTFFNALKQRYPSLRVYSGMTYYQPSIRNAALAELWHQCIENNFIFNRKAAWQSIPSILFSDDGVVIVELNPRNITSWLIAGVRKLLRKPIVFWGHAWPRSGPQSYTTFIRLIMWLICDVKIVYTVKQMHELSQILGQPIFPARNALYSYQSVRPRLECQNNGFIYVGRLVSEKKPELLLKAFALLASSNLDASLDFVGDGPEKKKLELLSESLKLSNRVCFHGHVGDNDKLRILYSRSVAALSPGYVGLSATQAFFFGVPMIIAAGEPHAPEIEACRDGVNCLFFPSDNAPELATVMVKMLNNRSTWAGASKSIQEDVCSRYSIEKMVDSFDQAISCAVGHSGIVI